MSEVLQADPETAIESYRFAFEEADRTSTEPAWLRSTRRGAMGAFERLDFPTMKDEDWQAILDTNLTSVYRTSKAVMRGMMKARKGRIINIASVIGVTGNAGQANYAAAKAGIIAFSKSLAKEIGSRGITVNAVAPGFIATDMTASLPEDARSALVGQIALGRLGEPADIARAVAFLAGPSAAYITGETLHVNGGMYMP